MLVRKCWLSGLFLIISTAALSTSSSTTKKSTVASSSTHHTSTSTTKKSSTSASSSTHHTSSSSPKTTTTSSPSTVPSSFYLIAENTRQSQFDNYYFKLITDPAPLITISGASALQFGSKTLHGAATFSLNADGALYCNNNVSNPLYACVSDGHTETQTLEFEYFANPEGENDYGMVTATCAIDAKSAVLTCEWYTLVDFYYNDSDVVNGTQEGEILLLGVAGDSTPFTIKVVPA